MKIIFLIITLFCSQVFASGDLMNDLLIVDYWNRQVNDRLPVTFNNYLQGGYINMPSARMGEEGEIGGGFCYVPPYRSYNLRFQMTSHFEVSGNYRVFIGVDDPILTPLGFGDLSDKGANFKWALFLPEDSEYELPGIAFGMDDFMGTRNFKAIYVVATKVFLNEDCEFTLGYGGDRLRGLFGGFSWIPFRKSCNPYLTGLSLNAEYDATPYHDEDVEKHPGGRTQKTKFNLGAKYRLWDHFDFSLSYVRGEKLACAVSGYYNFGYTKGFLPKIEDPLPYKAPRNIQPLGFLRPEESLVQDIAYAFRDQGLELYECWLTYNDNGQKELRIVIENDTYREEKELRNRLTYLLAFLIPADIDQVLVTQNVMGFPIQEYTFNMEFVREFGATYMCGYELKLLTPLDEATFPDPCTARLIFKREKEWYNLEILPKTHTFFGSSKGKFKYALGVSVGSEGFFSSDIYYSMRMGYIAISELYDLRPIDRLNPSQLINVNTDIVKYYQVDGVTLDEGYIQKNWNLGSGWYSSVSLGYFYEAYAGVATELLYYPVNSSWAIGFDGAILKKRTYGGLGFTNKIRKYDGFYLTHEKFLGRQFFLSLYYDWQDMGLDFKIKAGQFLARDWGARYEVSRYFPSGLRVTLWYTYTNGNDKINGHTYYDKGVAISMPIDVLYMHSSNERWTDSISAWLRDVGFYSPTGLQLYNLINLQRQ